MARLDGLAELRPVSGFERKKGVHGYNFGYTFLQVVFLVTFAVDGCESVSDRR